MRHGGRALAASRQAAEALRLLRGEPWLSGYDPVGSRSSPRFACARPSEKRRTAHARRRFLIRPTGRDRPRRAHAGAQAAPRLPPALLLRLSARRPGSPQRCGGSRNRHGRDTRSVAGELDAWIDARVAGSPESRARWEARAGSLPSRAVGERPDGNPVAHAVASAIGDPGRARPLVGEGRRSVTAPPWQVGWPGALR